MVWDFEKYWRENKEKINKERRDKYHANPEHRTELREKAKRNYEKTRRRMVPIDRRTVVSEDGKRYWSIGRIARLIGRNITTIRRYHKDGIIPEPKYFDKRGWRLFDTNQANIMRQAFRRLDDEDDKSVTSLKDVTALLIPLWDDGDKKSEE